MSGLRSRPNFREKPHRVDPGTHPPANRNKTNVNASKLKLPRLQDYEDRVMTINFLEFEVRPEKNGAVKIKSSFFAGVLFAAVSPMWAGPVELEPKETAGPPTITDTDHWYFNIASPGWLASVSGDIGLRGITSNVDVAFDQILRHIDGAVSLSAEARKGHFGAYADILYLSASAAIYPERMISKSNIFLSEYLVDGELYYRVYEGPRGYL